MNSLIMLSMLLLAARPGFEDGAPVLRAAAVEGALAERSAPTAATWDRAEAFQIPLRMTPPHMRTDEMPVQSIETLELRALAAADGLAIRIAWRDGTADYPPSRTREIGSFPDAVAVQFTAGASGRVLPALAMGSPETPVNIWRWSAGSDQAEESVSEGFGLLETVDEEPRPVGAAAVRVDGGWAVTLWRPYQVAPMVTYRGAVPGTGRQAERVAIEPGARLPCAFAVWNGSYEDRDGLKAVSIWYYLQLPAP
jgi:complex iron-sulfur molybdoenzyme family reductase subunit gamma